MDELKITQRLSSYDTIMRMISPDDVYIGIKSQATQGWFQVKCTFERLPNKYLIDLIRCTVHKRYKYSMHHGHPGPPWSTQAPLPFNFYPI